MKTYLSTLPSTTSNGSPAIAGSSRLANLGRLLLATLCVSLVSFTAAPKATAAAPNGVYQVTSASGTVKFGDDTIDLPASVAKRIADVTRGEITIRNKTLQLNKNATAKVVTRLADDLDIEVETTVSGPSSIVLSKVETTYKAKTAYPISTLIEGSFNGNDFTGQLDTEVRATVKGRTLKIVITFSGEALGKEFSGKLVVVAQR